MKLTKKQFSDRTKKLEKLFHHFNRRGFSVDLQYDYNFLYIHQDLALVSMEEDSNVFQLCFEVNCEPTAAANITNETVKYALKNKMKVDIYEQYAYVLSYKGEILEVIHGDEAQLYHETGEIPEKTKQIIEQDIKKNKQQVEQLVKIDAQKQVDAILEQIQARGIKSINKEQEKFLLDFSKGKTK